MRYDLLLFDLDGTISNPLTGIAQSINFALEEFGYETIEAAQLAKYIGPPLDEIFKHLTRSSRQGEILGLVSKYRERYSALGFAENVVYPGVPETLSRLHKMDMRMAVCTSKRRDFAERILCSFDLADFFLFVDGGEVGLHKWQQIAALHRRGRVTSATLMIGDRGIDLVAAHRNGLRAAGVLWGFGSREELMAENPVHLFTHPDEWLALSGVSVA